ncbi:hypothetical protein BOX15_Mlig026643g1 [Macrostomum lignano]|uniref:RING-type domain-containing protein n=2 Tax=Macrostomum lignano TaxID=282301 RepID=A0A267E1R9_9PLAT|nr:hypothetical protein BOX15_Mlig026643g1 [Macrostomum lignano]
MAFSNSHVMTSSRLVETIQINFEDFSESFLTCGTCLNLFDAGEHQPKLLPCSHTLCRSCLQRIMQGPGPGRQAESFRCPICREGIAVPHGGGAAAFPPSFVVNQLLDLMASQRRDLVPKCSIHSGRELLFCETCDTVFCPACLSHQAKADHTVLSFSVAVKRMTEILLYKATLAASQLGSAYEAVCREVETLDANAEACMQSVDQAFQQLRDLVDRRHSTVRETVKRVKEEKRRALKEQLELIGQEKARVESECEGLQYQMDVMAITKKISDLNAKLDTFAGLSEPRENAYMEFSRDSSASGVANANVVDDECLRSVEAALQRCGKVRVSTTHPGLCSVQLLSGADAATAGLRCSALLHTVDYHGRRRRDGDDPVSARLETPGGEQLEIGVVDKGDGSYELNFLPLSAGRHRLDVRVFGRPVRDCPLALDVAGRQRPAAKAGGAGRGSQPGQLQAPYAVAVGRNGEVYISDTGNSRIVVLDSTLRWLGDLGRSACTGQSATGLAVDAGGRLWVANWRQRRVFEVEPVEDRISSSLQSAAFREPGLVAVGPRGHVIVGDAGAGAVFVCDPTLTEADGALLARIDGLSGLTALAVGCHDSAASAVQREPQMLLCCAVGAKLLVYEIGAGQGSEAESAIGIRHSLTGSACGSSAVTGLALDSDGRLLASRATGDVEVHSRPLGEFLCRVVPEEAEKLRRPGGVASLGQGWLAVVDAQGHAVKKFRYV